MIHYKVQTRADTHMIYEAIKHEMPGASIAVTRDGKYIHVVFAPKHECNVGRLWTILSTFEHTPWYKRIFNWR